MLHAPSEKLSGKIVVITGANGTIARSIAYRLASQGATIIGLVRRNVSEVRKFFETLPGSKHHVIEADVTKTEMIISAVKNIQHHWGKCDILINNAAVSKVISSSNIQALTDDIFDEIIHTNLRGPYSVIREFYDLLKSSDDAIIINISSTSAAQASQTCIAYAASKAGLEIMTKSLSKIMAPSIRVIGIAPGHLDTATSGTKKDDSVNRLSVAIPLKRLATAEDVSRAIESCIIDMPYMTGHILYLDGGRTA